jgi:hypothetical protein
MINPAIKQKMEEQLNSLPVNLQIKVLEYAKSLSIGLPDGVSGKDMLKFVGLIDKDDLKIMSSAIEEDCEK